MTLLRTVALSLQFLRLSFIAVDHLEAWRAFLTYQLKRGAPIQTVQVFASLQGILVKNIIDYQTKKMMQQLIFCYVPRHRIEVYNHELLAKNVNLLNKCLG